MKHLKRLLCVVELTLPLWVFPIIAYLCGWQVGGWLVDVIERRQNKNH